MRREEKSMKTLLIIMAALAIVRPGLDVTRGVNLDENGNGQIISPYYPGYDYISYRGLDVEPGDEIVTVCFWTGECDNIHMRIDWRCN